MAIEHELATPGTAGPTRTAPQGNAQRSWSLFSNNMLGGISRRASSEVLGKVHEAFIKTLEANPIDSAYVVEVYRIDNTKSTELRLSSLVISVKSSQVSNVLAYHTVLLEESADPIPARVENIQGKPVNCRRFASDVYNQTYSQAVRDMLQQQNQGSRLIDCAGVVFPKGFNLEDKDAVRAFVQNAVLPAVSALVEEAPSYAPINLQRLERDCQLQSVISFNEQTRTDYSGLPVRNDVTVTLQAISNERQDANELNNQERSVTVAQVGGFIDFLWAPSQQQQQPYGQFAPGQNRKFAARFVATSLENIQGYTLENQLFALASILTLGEGTNWYPAFTPRLGAGKLSKTHIDPRDIGALNIEANVSDLTGQGGYGVKIDTRDVKFNSHELGKFIYSAVHPGLLFSVDVSALGSDTWYNEVFSAAAAGNALAVNAILDAANNLTNGAFASFYGNAGNPVMTNNERILLGWYIGADGQKHDIREFDYLAVANYVGEKDVLAPQKFSDTFLREEYPLAMRLEYREQMIQEIIGSEVVFTQQAQRVTFQRAFLEAFAKAVAATNVVIKPINPSMHGDYHNTRGTAAGWLSQAAMSTASVPYFSSGYSSQQPQTHQRFNGGNRWTA